MTGMHDVHFTLRILGELFFLWNIFIRLTHIMIIQLHFTEEYNYSYKMGSKNDDIQLRNIWKVSPNLSGGSRNVEIMF